MAGMKAQPALMAKTHTACVNFGSGEIDEALAATWPDAIYISFRQADGGRKWRRDITGRRAISLILAFGISNYLPRWPALFPRPATTNTGAMHA